MSSILHLLPGPFNFLRDDRQEVARLTGETPLPRPRQIFQQDEVATPLHGFPVLVSERMIELRRTLIEYILQEEALQLAIHRRQHPDRKTYAQAWEAYKGHLCRAVGNVTLSSYGRQFPSLFWLHHSSDVAALLKETPRRVLRQDTEVGRRHGDSIKYRVYDRWLDRVLTTTYDLVQQTAHDTDEMEEELFPTLLTRMTDNVLVFTEDHISRNLAELSAFFAGHLRIDGREFRQRLEALVAWHETALAEDAELRHAVVHLLEADPDRPWDLLTRRGYVPFLASRPGYPAEHLLAGAQVEVWERLLAKLKEFELYNGLRKLLLPVERRRREGGAVELVVSRRGSLGRTMVGRGETHLSPTTRPLDFMAPWVVDPQVARFGMIYDIADFSQMVSVLRRSGVETQDHAFRQMFLFQRRINRIAAAHRLTMEKYLGDGAFYSAREARRMLVTALLTQRLYSQALADGFPFDQGMRIALNFGQYRLIPIDGGPGQSGERYEFFGHGLVELSRLTTGKATREIEEIKTMLVNLGYKQETVHRFFAPLLQRNVDMVDRREENRRFYAYINQNGNLINEGMVATAAFISELDVEGRVLASACGPLYRVVEGDRRYVATEVEDPITSGSRSPERHLVGFRSLGKASLKGLDRTPVFEVVDLAHLDVTGLHPLHGRGLAEAIEREAGLGLGSWNEAIAE